MARVPRCVRCLRTPDFFIVDPRPPEEILAAAALADAREAARLRRNAARAEARRKATDKNWRVMLDKLHDCLLDKKKDGGNDDEGNDDE